MKKSLSYGTADEAVERSADPTLRLALSGDFHGSKFLKRSLADPTVRLGMPGQNTENLARRALADPTIRLAHPGRVSKPAFNSWMGGKGEAGPTVRLVTSGGDQGVNALAGQRGVERIPEESAPALLVSYYYLDGWLKCQEDCVYRDWVIDSGAFSAYQGGVTIDLGDYIKTCKHLLATDPKLVEVYSLDVIGGDWRESLANTERMWSEGVEAIPAFHKGEPWSVLEQLAKDYPKIALGGIALLRRKEKLAFAKQCFARVWPKKIHGFGCGGGMVLDLPFHSVDATSWAVGPVGFGNWRAYPGARVSWRGGSQNLRVEIEHFLRLEHQARQRWRKEMAILEETT